MQLWEYLMVHTEGTEVVAINQEKLHKPFRKSIEYFNALGLEGWEFVAVMNNGTAILKRPLKAEGLSHD